MALGARSRLWAGHPSPWRPLLLRLAHARDEGRIAPPARCCGAGGAAPSARYASVRSLPWGRDHSGSALARAKSGVPPAHRRSPVLTPAAAPETCRRHLSRPPASRHGGRERSASTRLPARHGSPRRLTREGMPPSLGGDARYGFRCTESSCPLRGWASRARRRSRRGPAAPLRGRSRQSPEDGTPLRGRSCRARAVPFGTLAQGAKVAALSARGRSRARLGPSRGRAPSRPGCRAA